MQREALPALYLFPAMGTGSGRALGNGCTEVLVKQLPRNIDPVERNSLHLTPVSIQAQGVLVSEGSTDTYRFYVLVRQETLALAGTRGVQFN